jgi:HD superfamily phosphohydrolase
MQYPKRIYDAVHGFIRFNHLEQLLIDSFCFQRLHYLHQLGIAFLVYPGATHTRFEHSLGVMELASRMYDSIIFRRPQNFNLPAEQDLAYWKQVVRLAALCHDLGHLPFSHVAEKALLGDGGHERWTKEIIQSPQLDAVWKALPTQRNAAEDIAKISLGENKWKEITGGSLTPWEKLVSEMITGDFFGADRIDYLLRDAKSTGVAYGVFDYHQLIEMICIVPSFEDKEWCLGVEENGVDACEALLLARHFMHERVYQYPSVKAYSFHLSRFMQAIYKSKIDHKTIPQYLSLTDNEVLSAARAAALDESAAGSFDARSLFDRKLRFKAIPLPGNVLEKSLIELRKTVGIPENEIFWFLAKPANKNFTLSFPVLKRSGAIVPAQKVSQISIPASHPSWVYVAPKWEKQVSSQLEN